MNSISPSSLPSSLNNIGNQSAESFALNVLLINVKLLQEKALMVVTSSRKNMLILYNQIFIGVGDVPLPSGYQVKYYRWLNTLFSLLLQYILTLINLIIILKLIYGAECGDILQCISNLHKINLIQHTKIFILKIKIREYVPINACQVFEDLRFLRQSVHLTTLQFPFPELTAFLKLVLRIPRLLWWGRFQHLY